MGRLPGAKVTPHSLQRPRLFESRGVTLADGQEWLLPRFHALPKRWKRNPETGELKADVAPEYADYFDACWAFHECVTHWGDKNFDRTKDEAWSLVVAGLALNYMLSDELVDWLGLLETEEALFTAPLAAINVLDTAELVEKNHGRYSRKTLESLAWIAGKHPEGYEPDLADLHALADLTVGRR